MRLGIFIIINFLWVGLWWRIGGWVVVVRLLSSFRRRVTAFEVQLDGKSLVRPKEMVDKVFSLKVSFAQDL